MKKIFLSMLVPALSVMLLASCEKDTDSNPTFQENTTGFVLNTPSWAAEGNVIDLANSETLQLTTNQPDYGGNVPYVTKYSVQVGIEAPASATPALTQAAADAWNHTELATTYTNAVLSVDGSEINDAVLSMYKAANNDNEPTSAIPIYIRLKAQIDGQDSLGICYSNIITIPSALATAKPVELTLPTNLYTCGSFIGAAWSTWKPMHTVYGMEGCFFDIAYIPDGGQFKWGTYEQEWLGYSSFSAVNDEASSGVAEAASDGNIQVSNGGWYVIYIESTIVGKKINYELTLYPAACYIIGACAGGSWTDSEDAWAMTAPADGSGKWVSPAFSGGGELRAYVKVGSYDWWRTEFTLHEGTLYWRTVDIPNNWAENVGSDYSVNGSTGQKLSISFDNGEGVETGSVE